MNILLEQKLNEFTAKVKSEVKSKAQKFKLSKAIDIGYDYATEEEKVFIKVYQYLLTKPLKDNQFYHYATHYQETGEKLSEDNFLYDLDALHKEYEKIDELKEGQKRYNLNQYYDYVLYISLKTTGHYKDEYDKVFKVTQKNVGGRYYTPLTKVPTVLRPYLPEGIDLIEFDIKRAYPTFIDLELGIKRTAEEYDAFYDVFDKRKFSMLLNIHKDSKNANIDNVRKQLEPIYGDKVNEVITEERFNEKGAFSRHFEQIETEYINKFIEANLKDKNIPYARLHDGLFIMSNVDAEEFKLEFDGVRFGTKENKEPNPLKEAPLQFYYFNEEGKAETNSTLLRDFLEEKGYIRVNEEGNTKMVVYRNENNSFVVNDYVWENNVVNDLKTMISHGMEVKNSIEQMIAKKLQSDIKQAFLLMDAYDFKYHRDDEDSCGMMFKNGYFELKRGEEVPTLKPYNGEKGFFRPNEMKDQLNFKYVNKNISKMERWVHLISTGYDVIDEIPEDEKENAKAEYQAFCSMIGYLTHSYNSKALAKAIILSDEGADGQKAKGGRGKGMFTWLMQKVTPLWSEDGKNVNFKYNHFFSGIREYHKTFVLQDVKASINWEDVYNRVTDDWTINRKGIDKKTVTADKAPKFVVTTNWIFAFMHDEESTIRRFAEYKFKPTFSSSYRPEHIFGGEIYVKFDEDEFNEFYSFIFDCVGFYLNNGLKTIEYDKEKDYEKMLFTMDYGERFGLIEKIWEVVKHKDEFNATAMLEVINTGYQVNKSVTRNNVSDAMSAYLGMNEITDFRYYKSSRKFVRVNKEPKQDTSDLPF